MPSWSVGKAAKGSPPLSAGLVTLLRKGTMPAALTCPPPVTVSMLAKIGPRDALQVADDRADNVAAEDVVAVAEGHATCEVNIFAGSRFAGNYGVGDRSHG